jgi:hypothetical protein
MTTLVDRFYRQFDEVFARADSALDRTLAAVPPPP